MLGSIDGTYLLTVEEPNMKWRKAMKKYLVSVFLVLCLSLTLAVSAWAVEPNGQVVSEEQYQEYVEIAKSVCQEYGMEYGEDVSACPISEVTKVYTPEEYRAEVEEFCEVISSLQNPITTYASGDSNSNPSAGGNGTKNLTVNSPYNVDGGYFLWTLHARAVIGGGGPYYYTSATMEESVLIRRPSNAYTCVYAAPRLKSSTSTTRVFTQAVTIKKNGVAVTATPHTLTAQLSLNTSTGVVTLRNHE